MPLEKRKANPGQQLVFDGRVLHTFAPGERKMLVCPGDDLEWTVDGAPVPPPVTPPAPTPPPVIPPVQPPGTDVLVKAGETINAALARAGSGTAGRPRVYGIEPSNRRENIDIRDYVRLVALGAVTVKGSLRGEGDRGFGVVGVTFDGTGIDATGIDIRNVTDAYFDGIRVLNFGGMGVTVLGHSGGRCQNVQFRNYLIADNHPQGPGHVSGLYAQATFGLDMDNGVFDRNGGAGNAATIFNHNCYIQSDCGPVRITDTVFARASSHGLQMRSGGTLAGCAFIDNPVHLSCGYLNGAKPAPGGIEADLARLVFVGTDSIAGKRRGWVMDIGNAKRVTVDDVLIAHNRDGGIDPAIVVKRCQEITGGAELQPSRWDVSITDVSVWDWEPVLDRDNKPKPHVDVRVPNENVRQRNTGNPPPTRADLRAIVAGVNLRTGYATAAPDIVSRCFAAAGL